MEERRRPSVDDARYEVLRGKLERAVARACPQWLASRREDIVQAALVKLMGRSGAEVDDMGSRYVFKVAYSCLVDEMRRQRRRKMPETSSPVEGTLRSQDADPERQMQSRELGRAIKECLERLAQTRNLAVSLYLQGCNVPQISGRVGWSRKQAENAVYRGLGDMRRCLSEKGVQP